MKRIFAILMVLFTTTSFASVTDEVKQDTTFSRVIEYDDILKQSLPIIEARISSLTNDPLGTGARLVQSVKDDADYQKIIKYNNYLAEKTFNEYKDRFIADLYRRGQETNRAVRTKNYGDGSNLNLTKETFIWLDAGIMDSEQCNGGTYKAKDYSREEVEKQLKDQRDHTCLYPDGFEDYTVVIQDAGNNNNNTKILLLSIDSVANNTHKTYEISLSKEFALGNPKNETACFYLDVSTQETTYYEHQTERNNWQQDIKDGMREYKEDGYCLNGRCQFTEIKDMSKWRSGNWGADYKVKEMATGHSINHELEGNIN